MSRLDLSKIHFLIIDDFANYRSMLRSILVSCGAQHIEDASNAADALKKVTYNKFDVILCDYNLGDGQNGQQLLEEIMHRRLIPYGTIYIMITAENTQNMVMAAVEYRPDGYLNKPFPKELLLKRLDMLVQKKAIMKDIYRAYNKKDYQKALELADEKMAQHNKQALEIGKLKGEIALAASKLDIALEVYNKALSIRDFQWARVGKARALLQSSNYAEAQTILEGVIRENKNYIEAYDLLAQALEQQGKLEQVQEVLTQASTISPHAIARQQHLANVAIKNGDSESAKKALKKAVREGKYSCFGKVDDNLNLAKLYLENGQNKNAIQTIKTTKQTYKKDATAMSHTQIIECLMQNKLGNEDMSRELFQQAIAEIPEDLSIISDEFKTDLLTITEQLGETELAEALQDNINNGPGNSNAEEITKSYQFLLLNGKGIRLYTANRIAESIPYFEQAADHLPERISVNMNAAQALMFYIKNHGRDDQMLEKARHYLDICKNLDPENEKYQKLEAIYTGLS